MIDKINFIGVFLPITPIKFISWRSQIASSEVHLSSSTAGTQKKCCANGCLSLDSDSDNFDEELMNEHELDPMLSFLRKIISTCSDIS